MYNSNDVYHDLDYGEINELDEISGDYQLVLIWCETHQTYEVALDRHGRIAAVSQGSTLAEPASIRP